jgi:hypothetical protein
LFMTLSSITYVHFTYIYRSVKLSRFGRSLTPNVPFTIENAAPMLDL